ncbi:MAG: hypothetical protein M3P30_01320 [Chloroflexota bacterium]|nr:hypothetical protein [Chloroflexota bacterium]
MGGVDATRAVVGAEAVGVAGSAPTRTTKDSPATTATNNITSTNATVRMRHLHVVTASSSTEAEFAT